MMPSSAAPDDNDRRRRATLARYTGFVFVAYAIAQLAGLAARLLGLSTVRYGEIGAVAAVTLGVTAVFYGAVRTRRTITRSFSNGVFFGQFVVWLVMYGVWLVTLREVRVMALFCASMALSFLLASARWRQSLAVAVGAMVVQVAGSWVAIRVLGQPGSFAREVYFTVCFAPSAVFICYLSDQYATQRRLLAEARRQAERSRDEAAEETRNAQTLNEELQRALARIEQMATHDELTGLFNRRHLMGALETQRHRAERGGRFSLVMLDIDHFKHVNDMHGHPAGDAVLRRVGAILGASMRATDMCARYGGEEFMLVLEGTDGAPAFECAERIRRSIESAMLDEVAPGFRITASLGLAIFHVGEAVSQTIARADEALYRAKREGRNRTVSGDASVQSDPLR